jgi:hypothetical protein
MAGFERFAKAAATISQDRVGAGDQEAAVQHLRVDSERTDEYAIGVRRCAVGKRLSMEALVRSVNAY